MGKQKMMDICVQEITALVYLKRVPEETKDVVLKVAYSFNAVVDKVDNFPRASIPTKSWHIFFQM